MHFLQISLKQNFSSFLKMRCLKISTLLSLLLVAGLTYFASSSLQASASLLKEEIPEKTEEKKTSFLQSPSDILKDEQEPFQSNVAFTLKEQPTKSEDEIYILSIDGGGIRGLIPAMILNHLEESLTDEFGFEVYVSDFFSLMAGTSTGSIIALGLSRPADVTSYLPQYKASKLVDLYGKEGDTIFTQEWARAREALSYTKVKYSGKALDKLLKTYLDPIMISQAVKGIDLLVPTYNITSNQEYYFDGYEAKKDSAKDVPMWKAGRSSAAAPTYLPACEVEGHYFIDGGVFMNDPSLAAYNVAKTRFPNKKIVMISLGTGEAEEKLPVEALKEAGKLLSGSHLGWAKFIPSVMMRGAAGAIHQFMKSFKDRDELEYYRVQATLDEAVLDNTSKEAIGKLKEAAVSLYSSENANSNNTTQSVDFSAFYEKLRVLCQKKKNHLDQKLNQIDREDPLDLSASHISNVYVETLASKLQVNPRLTTLILKRNGLNGPSIVRLCQVLEQNTHLTSLDLSENRIGLEGLNALGRLLGKTTKLSHLSIASNGLNLKEYGKGASLQIAPFVAKRDPKDPSRYTGEITSLTYIDFSSNHLGKPGFESLIRALQDVKSSPQIQINLIHNGIGSDYKQSDLLLSSSATEKERLSIIRNGWKENLTNLTAKAPQTVFILKGNDFEEERANILKQLNVNFQL